MSVCSDAGKKHPGGPQRKLCWKTEWLVYCFYVHGNASMKQVAPLFGIGTTLIHDIVYAWANFLCISLEKLFPVPTRSWMLRPYPKSALKNLDMQISSCCWMQRKSLQKLHPWKLWMQFCTQLTNTIPHWNGLLLVVPSAPWLPNRCRRSIKASSSKTSVHFWGWCVFVRWRSWTSTPSNRRKTWC